MAGLPAQDVARGTLVWSAAAVTPREFEAQPSAPARAATRNRRFPLLREAGAFTRMSRRGPLAQQTPYGHELPHVIGGVIHDEWAPRQLSRRATCVRSGCLGSMSTQPTSVSAGAQTHARAASSGLRPLGRG